MPASREDLEQAVHLLAEATAGPNPDPGTAAELGWVLAERFVLEGDEGDRDRAIAWLSLACDADLPDGNEPVQDLELAMLLIGRGEDRHDGTDIQAAMGYAQRSLAGLDGEYYPLARYVLGVANLVQADLGSATPDFSAAAGHLRAAAALLPDGHPERPGVDARLGVALAAWIHADPAADGADPPGRRVTEAIGLLAKALQELPPGDLFLIRVRCWLATASAMRFIWYAGSEADRQMAVSEYETVLGEPALDATIADLCHVMVASLHLAGSAPDIVRRRSGMAEPSIIRALTPTPLEPSVTEAARTALGHLDRVSGIGAMAPPYGSIEPLLRGVANFALASGDPAGTDVGPSALALEEAMRLTPPDAPEMGELHGMLGLLYSVQAMRGDAADASGRSIESLAAAAMQLGGQHPLLPFVRGMLGGAGGFPLGGRAPSREESAAAIDLLEAVIDKMPEDHPARAETLTRLGGLLIGAAFNLDQAVPRLRRLRRRLEPMIGRPAGSQLNTAINLFLLGMAEGVEGLVEPDAELAKTAADRLTQAANIAPAEGRIRAYIQSCLICLLAYRYSQEGELQILDAAMHYAGELASAMGGAELSDPLLLTAQYMLVVGPAVRNHGLVDREQLSEMIAQVDVLLARMPDDSAMRTAVTADLSIFRLLLAGPFGSGGGHMEAGPGDLSQVADSAVALARATSWDDPFYAVNLGIAGNARAMQGTSTLDRSALSEGIAMLAEACHAAKAVPDHRRRLLTMLACALRMRYELTHNRSDLSNVISRLEEARRLADEDQGGTDMAGILYLSAASCFDRNDRNLRDRRRAAAYGLSALRERAATVMLQSTTDRALDAALSAAGEASDVARWCLADGNAEAAVEALERGRGMVLHAATADASVPFLLRAAGHKPLAGEWEAALSAAGRAEPDPWDQLPSLFTSSQRAPGNAGEVTGSPELRLPDDLRYRALKALAGTELERLLAPPSMTEITQALRASGAQALIYLLPRDQGGAGLALMVSSDGQICEIPLPALTAGPRGPVVEFAEAQRNLFGAAASSDGARQHWQRALDALCDWAWTAAMDRVLDAAGGERRRARLVIVPVGDLGLVPWHAARRQEPGGDFRYACQDAIISYAASARQFTEAWRNGHRPWDQAPALVRVPDSGLYFASKELQEIHRIYYPQGMLLGDPDRRAPNSAPANVLGLLPRPGASGASLLHLGCHAEPAPRPVDRRLLLEGGETLSMRDILHQARARQGDIPGPLVILAACGSDLASGYHDEALTLATSFLAAGAVGVVGTRWPVNDRSTLALMLIFHHYLNSGYGNPATALSAAQAWMLNPHRLFPEGFHPKIVEIISTIDLANAQSWAAFTYQGQ